MALPSARENPIARWHQRSTMAKCIRASLTVWLFPRTIRKRQPVTRSIISSRLSIDVPIPAPTLKTLTNDHRPSAARSAAAASVEHRRSGIDRFSFSVDRSASRRKDSLSHVLTGANIEQPQSGNEVAVCFEDHVAAGSRPAPSSRRGDTHNRSPYCIGRALSSAQITNNRQLDFIHQGPGRRR